MYAVYHLLEASHLGLIKHPQGSVPSCSRELQNRAQSLGKAKHLQASVPTKPLCRIFQHRTAPDGTVQHRTVPEGTVQHLMVPRGPSCVTAGTGWGRVPPSRCHLARGRVLPALGGVLSSAG